MGRNPSVQCGIGSFLSGQPHRDKRNIIPEKDGRLFYDRAGLFCERGTGPFLCHEWGNLENNGYSVGLSGVPVKTRDWQWNLYTYFSGNLNKVRSQTVEKYTIDSYLNGTALVDGEAVSSFYSYRFLGLNPANGIPVFNDYADRMHLLEDRELEDIVLMTMEKSGQRDPIFTGSLSTSLTYKSLSLSVNMSYSLGSKVRLFSLYEPILNGVSAEKI